MSSLSTAMKPEEIKESLEKLQPEIPWTHYFDFGHDIHTVTPKEEKFYKKAVGLGKLGDLVPELAANHTRKGTLKGQDVLDIACAEGRHSITMAKHGANVLGVEGRGLYVERARLAANALGYNNARFIQGDCRKMNKADIGTFDVVLCSGILHHLGQESFVDFINDLGELTDDTLIMYTHVSTPDSIERFRLQGPVTIDQEYEGYLFREHKDGATKEDQEKKVRASLDNTHSFWATPESLVKALRAAGFSAIYNILSPHIFSNPVNAAYRPILIARK